MSYPSIDTTEALRRCMDVHRTLKGVARALGFPESYAASFSAILNRKPNIVSKQREDEIRHRLNLFPAGVTRLDQIPVNKLGDLIRWRR